jgi:hypothetical protein
MAQTAEETRGKVTQYTLGPFTEPGNTSDVTMQVSRNKQTYPVQLRLKREGNNWKIINADRI